MSVPVSVALQKTLSGQRATAPVIMTLLFSIILHQSRDYLEDPWTWCL